MSTLLLVLTLLSQPSGDPVTVQMRNGQVIQGQLEDLERGTLFIRVSLHDQRQLQISDVALIDRVGGAAGLPDTEVNAARANDHLLLTRGGESISGTLIDIAGGPGSGQDNAERMFIFRERDGRQRSVPGRDVGRVYLGAYPFAAAVVSQPGPVPAPAVAPPAVISNVGVGGIHVPAAAPWVSTGLVVRRGQRIGFNTSGQVRLSANEADVAGVNGNSRFPANGPLPEVAAGGLIGRVGANGMPFGIGAQPVVPMPGDGVLYLAVNDDERSDNAGEFIVTVTPIDIRRR